MIVVAITTASGQAVRSSDSSEGFGSMAITVPNSGLSHEVSFPLPRASIMTDRFASPSTWCLNHFLALSFWSVWARKA